MAGSHVSHVSFLDPRKEARPPWADSVWIPWNEIASRAAELPPAREPVHVLGDPDHFALARSALDTIHRVAIPAGNGIPVIEPVRGRLWRPNAWLVKHSQRLTPGRALDLGCGGGRDSVHLAACGWNVVAADWLPDALERTRELAVRYLGHPAANRIDLRRLDLRRRIPSGPFDLVVAFFWLDRSALRAAAAELARGGTLLVEAFLDRHFEATGRPRSPDRRLRSGEIHDLLPHLELVEFEEGCYDETHTVRAAWRASSSPM